MSGTKARTGAFARALRTLSKVKVAHQRRELAEYPFDGYLLKASQLYRVSRYLYVEGGGAFEATLVSAARTLSSPILLEQRIEYSPIERELVWRATDSRERANVQSLLDLKSLLSCVFHEQNHRILWRLLPPAPRTPGELHRYLNFAEALVIVTDMALGDELGMRRATPLKTIGVLYDPGSSVSPRKLGRRAYRNYLQACLHATYLALEGFEPVTIAGAVARLYANTPLVGRALQRAANLNPGFIMRTNRLWQQRYQRETVRRLGKRRGTPLVLADDPLNNWQQYVFAEKWFDQVEL
ncbi:MAG: hypothetical protein HY074_14055 [Deltaproteobacteria bacterium]|nr:hypothetical protein [Deltaproteobacteria bacterium]